MAPIEGWYRQQVHERQYEREYGSHRPEALPHPLIAKHFANRRKSAQAFAGFDAATENLSKSFYLIIEKAPTFAYTCRNSREQAVLFAGCIKEICLIIGCNTDTPFSCGREFNIFQLTVSDSSDDDLLARELTDLI